MVAPPTVHISQFLIGRVVLLLGMVPLLMNVGVREERERMDAAERTTLDPAAS